MELRIAAGHNFKRFVVIDGVVSKDDWELYDIIKGVLFRKEYNAFLSSFNKTISYSYLFQDFVFPIQFLQDVNDAIKKFRGSPLNIRNVHLIYDSGITREEFDEWLGNLKFPEKFDTKSKEYDYQRNSAFLALKYQMGRVEIGTSGGKTFMTYLYLKYILDHQLLAETENGEEKRMLVVVPTQLLAKQLKKDFGEFNTYIERPLSVESIYSGAKKLINADVVCGTFQSLCEYDTEYYEDFGVLVCDELHRAKAYSIRNGIFAKMLNCEYFFGMTGTEPEYNTLEYLHIVSMFGHKLLTIEAHELIKRGVATPVKIEVIDIKYLEHSNFSKDLILQEIKGIEKMGIEKQFFHNYEPRNKLLAKLLNAIPDNSLILVNTVEYCYILYDFLTEHCPDWHFEVIHGINKEYKLTRSRDDIIQGMRETEKRYCIIGTFKTMSTGISINNLFNAYLPDGGKAATNIGQSIGRLMRLFSEKVVGRLFDFQDDVMSSSFRNHAKERNKYYTKKKFPKKISTVKI